MDKIYKEEPIELISIRSDGDFEITIDGINFFSSLKQKKIAIVSIVGPYRSGKSLLANILSNK